MNVLVTGGAGYIGRVVVEMLLQQGFSVVVVDSLIEGHRSALPADITFYKEDIGNRGAIKRILVDQKVDAVIHMAGETLVSKSMIQPEDYFKVNVSKGLELLEAMREAGTKRIIFSSMKTIK